MDLPKTRLEAALSGSRHYYTGAPCPQGHFAPRFTSVGTCKECGRTKALQKHVHTTSKRRAYNSRDSFVLAARALHKDRFSYENAVYVNAHTPLEITCMKHGAFMQNPTNHMQAKGCPKCMHEAAGDRSRSDTTQFIKSAVRIFGNVYDYSLVNYTRAHKKITIVCRAHGAFMQTPTNHLTGKAGCSKCNHMKSAAEDSIFALVSNYTHAIQRDRKVIAPKELDILLPERNLAIEYCGMYWHSHFNAVDEKADKLKHTQKYEACKAQGIRLITMYESEWLEHRYALQRLLRNACGKGRGKLMARKCELRKVSNTDARAFYDRYHPQGGAGHGEHYGLFWKDKLVACMRFNLGANDRGAGAGSRTWTLGRYATRITVAGAASRLFKAFVNEFKPQEVKSFSDNRYFEGGMYEQLGFSLEADVAPDYQVWSPKLGLSPKPHYQRRQLQKRLQEHEMTDSYVHETDPRTEAQMTYLMKAGRIYDCGKKRWVWGVDV